MFHLFQKYQFEFYKINGSFDFYKRFKLKGQKYDIYIYLLYCHLLPPPQIRQATCQEITTVKEKPSLRKRRKAENFPFMPFNL